MAKKHQPEYQVGYCKPPKAHQFKKGQSGNPKGKKKRSRDGGDDNSFAQHFLDLMAEPITVNTNGRPRTVPIAKAIALKLTQQVLAGNMSVARIVLPLVEQGRQRATVRADSFDLEELNIDQHAAERAYRRMITGK